jgi:predicted restriction endonuclease
MPLAISSPSNYNFNFTDGIIKYMQTRAGPTSKELNEVADAEKFLSKSEYGVIGKIEKDLHVLIAIIFKEILNVRVSNTKEGPLPQGGLLPL